MSNLKIKVGDYVEGFEDTLPYPRRTRGWISEIIEDLGFADIKVDDEYKGYRGTLYALNTIEVLPYKEEI